MATPVTPGPGRSVSLGGMGFCAAVSWFSAEVQSIDFFGAQRMALPIEYKAILTHANGETEIELTEPGWLGREEMRTLRAFALKPSVAHLPAAVVNLDPLADGTPRRLVYFSRVVGKLNAATSEREDRFRLYCIGWQATIEGRNVRSLVWIYPNGSVIASEEPMFVEAMLASC